MRLNKIIIVSILCLIGGLTNLSAQSSTKDVEIKAVSEYYMNAVNLYYGPILMTIPALNTIESVCNTKNWIFVPDSGGSLHD